MIIQKTIVIDNKEYLQTYSDIDMKIIQVETNIKYSEAIDSLPCRYTYKETDEPINSESEISEEEFFNMIKEVL